jgi:hypothetical protein
MPEERVELKTHVVSREEASQEAARLRCWSLRLIRDAANAHTYFTPG